MKRRRPSNFLPALEALEDRLALTLFTMTSPTSAGRLPDNVSPVGGIVLDLIGVNGRRVVSQLSAGALFKGMFDDGDPEAFRGNPGTIGVQVGFTPALLDALGPGLKEVAVRLTLFDGDTAPGNFDAGDNQLLVNGLPLGNFSDVGTEETSQDGQSTLSHNDASGFRNDTLDTGFFHSTDPPVVGALRAALLSTGTAVFQLLDADPFDNFFDFTRGLSGGAIDVGRPPSVENLPPTVPGVTVEHPGAETTRRAVVHPSRAPRSAPAVAPALPPATSAAPAVVVLPVASPNPIVPVAPSPALSPALVTFTQPVPPPLPAPSVTTLLTRQAMMSGGGGAPDAPQTAVRPRAATRPLSQAVGSVRNAVAAGLRRALFLAQALGQAAAGLRGRMSPAAAALPPPAPGQLAAAVVIAAAVPATRPQASPRARAVVWTVLLALTGLVVQYRWAASARTSRALFRRRRQTV